MTRRTTDTDGSGDSDGGRLSTDQVFDLLRSRERRRVLELLCDADGAVAVATLARHVAGGDATEAGAGEDGDPGTDAGAGGAGTARAVGGGVDAGESAAGGSGKRATLVALEHVHLPRLAEAGVVAYDREAGSVRYLGDSRVEAVLDALAGS